ncbi:hypothetical protein KTE12_15030 [Burkholderia multivorans]|nr:hypothetical protein [Burkholderia multivorans]
MSALFVAVRRVGGMRRLRVRGRLRTRLDMRRGHRRALFDMRRRHRRMRFHARRRRLRPRHLARHCGRPEFVRVRRGGFVARRRLREFALRSRCRHRAFRLRLGLRVTGRFMEVGARLRDLRRLKRRLRGRARGFVPRSRLLRRLTRVGRMLRRRRLCDAV